MARPSVPMGWRNDTFEGIEALIEPVVRDLGFEVVRIGMTGRGGSTLQIMCEPIDRTATMSVEDCADISHAVSAVLDVADPISEAYTLEISSPGLDRPLTKLEHFERFEGAMAKLEIDPPLEGRKRFRGVLGGVRDGMILLELGDATAHLDMETIKKANLIVSDATRASDRR